MSFLLVPNEVASDSANLWIGVVNEGVGLSDASLMYNGNSFDLTQGWQTYRTRSGFNAVRYQHIKLQNLSPRTDYILEFSTGGKSRASGRIRTLPEELPTIFERPFNVLLASCFASSRSESILLGSSYLNLQKYHNDKTDIKILCGDQVYLDDPAVYFLKNTHSYNDLEDLLFANYVRTWTQNQFLTGFQQFLQNGANFFSSDDHEFWNNAPNRATLIRDSWRRKGRENWLEIAKNLLGIFQPRSSKPTFNVGTLSFFNADTRIDRDADRDKFMTTVDLLSIEHWVQTLKGVGVLIIGQPLFAEKAGFFGGRFGDWNLPNYEQYKDLVRILNRTNHSILVLTGDVHYGRISHCQVRPNIFIYEIISSPTALVNPLVGGSWSEAPGLFPVNSIPGTVQKRVKSDFKYKETKNHFLTLSFQKEGGKTRIVLKVCEIAGNGQMPKPVKVDEFTLF
ncbi:MAG: hypothetical protein HKN25_12095 [Pyrinomonadaceae bacterium]|nr:hypothetical protein [Pyrinomonadaceae bacterium]